MIQRMMNGHLDSPTANITLYATEGNATVSIIDDDSDIDSDNPH